MKNTPSATVEAELAQVPKGEPGSALNQYRAIYAIVRQRGLGKSPEDVEPTILYAHLAALEAARSTDPQFDTPAPLGE